MREALVFVGIGALVIILGVIAINQRFTKSADNEIMPHIATMSLTLSSTAFSATTSIPSEYTCDGGNPPAGGSPPLSIAGAPQGTKTFALIVEDPDVPKQLKPDGIFLHWVAFNIPGSLTEIVAGAQIGVQGANGTGKNGYAGPCPPPQYEPSEHRYVFTLYALDSALPLKAGAKKEDVVKAMEGNILEQSVLIGKYKRK